MGEKRGDGKQVRGSRAGSADPQGAAGPCHRACVQPITSDGVHLKWRQSIMAHVGATWLHGSVSQAAGRGRPTSFPPRGRGMDAWDGMHGR